MTIDKPMEPRIPELPLGVSREIEMLGDPCGGDGGGGGKRRMRDGTQRGSRSMLERRRDGTQRGSRSMLERRRDGTQRGSRSNVEEEQRRKSRRRSERTGHARNAAEEPGEVWRRNPRDGTWRRFGTQPGLNDLPQGELWITQADTEENLRTIVSIADPTNNNHPVYFDSADIRETAHSQKGKYSNCFNSFSFSEIFPFRFI